MEPERAFSLWLTPDGEARRILSDLISSLSEKLRSPRFPPHVTLIGSLHGSPQALKRKSSELAVGLKPYRINLGRVEYLDEYFRSLFIRVEETEDVLRANALAREIFNARTNSKYFPHLSILYGNFSASEKEAIIQELGKEFKMSFEVKSLQLVDTSDKPESWSVLEEFAFGH
jgi:2'-5' RNA ligase